MIPVFERAKTFHALDRAATVTGSPNIIRVTNSRRMRQYTWGIRNAHKNLVGRPERKKHLGDSGLDMG
jgi:hypothetical protein